ncbi:MAG: hypothetical protein ACI8WT_000749 [Clostridium sp.]|jgi:hypothetical protein
MKNNKSFKTIAKVLSTVVILSSMSMSVFAKDGDIYNSSDVNLGGIGNILLNKRETVFDMIRNLDEYKYEISNDKYNAYEVNDIFNTNVENTIPEIYTKVKNKLIALENEEMTESSVTVKYIDKDTESSIGKDVVYSGKVGEEIPKLDIPFEGYNFFDISMGTAVIFTGINQTIIVRYFKVDPIKSEGTVTISYIDESTKEEIAKNVTVTGAKEELYERSVKVIDGYTYLGTDDPIGNFVIGDKKVTYSYTKDEIAIPEGTIELDSLIGALEKTSRLFKISETVYQLETQKVITNLGDTLEYEDAIKSSLKFNGSRPLSVEKLETQDTRIRVYKITIENKISESSVNLNIPNLSLDAYPDLIDSANFDVIVELKEEEPGDPMTPEINMAINEAIFDMACTSKLYEVTNKVFRLDIKKDISYSTIEMEYETSLLNEIRIEGCDVVSVVKVEDSKPDFNSYEITLSKVNSDFALLVTIPNAYVKNNTSIFQEIIMELMINR